MEQRTQSYSSELELAFKKQRLEEVKNITEHVNRMWQNITGVLAAQIAGQIKLNKLSLSYLSHKTGINTDTLKEILQNNSNSLPITEYLKILLLLNKDFSFEWSAGNGIFHVHIGKKEEKGEAKKRPFLARNPYNKG